MLFIYLLLRRRLSLLRREDKQYIQQSEVCRSVGSSFLLLYAHFSIQKPSHQTERDLLSHLLSSHLLSLSHFFVVLLSSKTFDVSIFFFLLKLCVIFSSFARGKKRSSGRAKDARTRRQRQRDTTHPRVFFLSLRADTVKEVKNKCRQKQSTREKETNE